MPDWFKTLVTEAAVIQSAPWSFAAIALAVMVGTFGFVTWIYGRQIETKDANIKWQSEQIAEYKSKLGGATPDEAKRRLDALEIQIKALSPRRLTDDQRDKIGRALLGSKGAIEVARDMSVADAGALAGDFALSFQAAGWAVSLPAFMGLANPPKTGIALQVANPTSLLPAEMVIKRGLDAAKIEYDLQQGPPRTAFPQEHIPDVRVLITTRLN